MKKIFMICTFIIFTIIPIDSFSLTGLDIAKNMDNVDTSKSSNVINKMTINRGNATLTRVMDVKLKKYGSVEKQFIKIFEPSDVKDTSYLIWNYKDVNKEDDMWIFMPAEAIVRRINGGGKKGPFMRSDFSNEDITKREVEDDEFKLIKEDDINGAHCYVIEAYPVKKDRSGYSKRTIWVRKDIWLPAKIEYYNATGKKIKECIYGGYKKVSGIWMSTIRKMTTEGSGTYSILETSNIQLNIDISDSVFDQSNMKR